MSVWALLSAPLIAGNDLRTMSDVTKSILTNSEVIAIDQDQAVNPAHAVRQPGASDMLPVWAKTLADGSVAVGLFNRTGAPAPMTVTWKAIGFDGQVRVRDLWAHRDLAAAGDRFTATVPTHGVVLLKVSAAR